MSYDYGLFLVETVLSITGAVVGTFLCFVFPSALYILSISKDHNTRTTAKVDLVIFLFSFRFYVNSKGFHSFHALSV